MPPRSSRATSPTRNRSVDLLPPSLQALGELPFTSSDRDTLRLWLDEAGWPRERMDIAMLEGYLAALLVWPIGVMPGAWLPPIWGEQRGWRVPEKIREPEAYTKFIRLIIGFLQAIDRELCANPPQFAPMICAEAHTVYKRPVRGLSWAQGFLLALQRNLQGLTWRSTAARASVECIARHASQTMPSGTSDPAVCEELTAAVLTLAAERHFRGPLGEFGT